MKLVQLTGTPQALAAFHRDVRMQLRGRARRKASGCRAGQYIVQPEAVNAFKRLAREHGVTTYAYDAAELERPRWDASAERTRSRPGEE